MLTSSGGNEQELARACGRVSDRAFLNIQMIPGKKLLIRSAFAAGSGKALEEWLIEPSIGEDLLIIILKVVHRQNHF